MQNPSHSHEVCQVRAIKITRQKLAGLVGFSYVFFVAEQITPQGRWELFRTEEVKNDLWVSDSAQPLLDGLIQRLMMNGWELVGPQKDVNTLLNSKSVISFRRSMIIPSNPQPINSISIKETLQQLLSLRNKGILSEAEFQAKKREILNRL